MPALTFAMPFNLHHKESAGLNHMDCGKAEGNWPIHTTEQVTNFPDVLEDPVQLYLNVKDCHK